MKTHVKPKLQLVLLSFLILFLELALIRYVPANVRLVGFFSNLVLMATFTGLGAGLILPYKKAGLRLFPFLLLLFVVLLSVSSAGLKITSAQVIFFDTLSEKNLYVEPLFILPLLYLAVSLLFVPLGSMLKASFGLFVPLTAYSLDILGSILGIVLFTLLSFLIAPAWIWFLIISLLSWLLFYVGQKNTFTYLALMALLIIPLVVFFKTNDSVWSPYYKITVTQVKKGVYSLSTNNIPHQSIRTFADREPFYFIPYEKFNNPVYKKVLIIGAGTGGDTAVTLAENPAVELIDAVEIDPVILEYGKTLHPDKPFSDPKVRLHNRDGREFLQQSSETYDLIVFALTDSLTLLGPSSGIRLESFLFTNEALALAKDHLTPQGLLVLYNYYREPWLIKKLSLMLNEVFGQDNVHVVSSVTPGRPATLLAGGKIADLKSAERLTAQTNTNLPLAKDDWPFLYLKNKTIPEIYIAILAVIFIISLILVGAAFFSNTDHSFRFDSRLFFLGAAFMLLETKSLVTFSLLFGSTWMVNSLVFTAMLVFVLAANIISSKVTFKKLYPFYIVLFIGLSLHYVIPSSYFFGLSMVARYVFSSVFYFTPIMVANIIFSQVFKKSVDSAVSFGSNLLGCVFGAIFEYSSLMIGFKALTLFIALFYSLSLVRVKRSPI